MGRLWSKMCCEWQLPTDTALGLAAERHLGYEESFPATRPHCSANEESESQADEDVTYWGKWMKLGPLLPTLPTVLAAVRRASHLPAGGARDSGLPHILSSLIFLLPSPFPVSFCSALFLCFLPEFSLPKFSSLSSTALAPFVILPSPLLFFPGSPGTCVF